MNFSTFDLSENIRLFRLLAISYHDGRAAFIQTDGIRVVGLVFNFNYLLISDVLTFRGLPTFVFKMKLELSGHI